MLFIVFPFVSFRYRWGRLPAPISASGAAVNLFLQQVQGLGLVILEVRLRLVRRYDLVVVGLACWHTAPNTRIVPDEIVETPRSRRRQEALVCLLTGDDIRLRTLKLVVEDFDGLLNLRIQSRVQRRVLFLDE